MFKELCEKYNLGNELNYEEIKGGLTNKIYKLTTDKDCYIIKILNNNNYDKIGTSEQIANTALKYGVNSIPALEFGNKYIQDYNDKKILIYKNCDGKVLLTKELTLEHVKILASQLAKLHSIKINKEVIINKYSKINYKKYYNVLKNNDEEWSKLFRNNIDYLCEIYDKVYDNYLKLSNQQSYVHKDYNRRNVLWIDKIPNIIDWETATIDNPSIDFFNSAWFLTADVDENKYYVFAKEYLSQIELIDDIETGSCAAIIEECNWLEFSLKRALVLQSNDEYEINLGKESISSSLKEIINYYNKIPLMIKIINDVKKEIK